MNRPHALVVGGSGMLAPLCRLLSDAGWFVSVVGRDRAKLEDVPHGRKMLLLSVDYRDRFGFAATVIDAVAQHGPIELSVCWIRSSEPESLRVAADLLAPRARLVHVLGSAGMRDRVAAEAVELGERSDISYRQVVLGEVREKRGRRWLTHAEISKGVFDAIRRDEALVFVGTTPEPQASEHGTRPGSSPS